MSGGVILRQGCQDGWSAQPLVEGLDKIAPAAHWREKARGRAPKFLQGVGVAAGSAWQPMPKDAALPLLCAGIIKGRIASVDPFHSLQQAACRKRGVCRTGLTAGVCGYGGASGIVHDLQHLSRRLAGFKVLKRPQEQEIPLRSGVFHADDKQQSIRLHSLGHAVSCVHGVVISNAYPVQPPLAGVHQNIRQLQPAAWRNAGVDMQIDDHTH